ncbi:YcxB family protein [Micromonospora sp. PLK6-60]|uniref:YcxB family protein n=1 Tax=Micromonospora sp. PLK6-60 TaxID=2873383 RepID=UPI001CA6EF92|nr:YcxB family protein [Micromonospora sp. PLK6-60]MBY8870270.1 YcxB family protein [Micromonospora sp. PLK6-60]
MRIRTEVQPDRRRLAAALRHAQRRLILAIRAGGVIFWLLALIYLALGAEARAVLHAVGGAVIFWAVPAFLIWLGGWASWRIYGIPTGWEFTDDGVHAHNELMDSTIRWPALNRVTPIPGQLLFTINWFQVVPVPTTDMAPEDLRTLVRFLRDRGLIRETDSETLATVSSGTQPRK